MSTIKKINAETASLIVNLKSDWDYFPSQLIKFLNENVYIQHENLARNDHFSRLSLIVNQFINMKNNL